MNFNFKTTASSFFILISILIFAQSIQAKKNNPRNTFHSQDASNWEYIINDKSLNPTDVFKMDNGVLSITGKSSGYLRTRKALKNYKLKLEWRWTKVLGNSGVLVHIQSKDSIWPVCYQIQQKSNAAGDIICMNGLWAKECTDSVKSTIPKLKPSNEKPIGEWNNMEIICKKNTIKVYVNNVLQNSITNLNVNKGFVGFQNEGKPLELRNLSIKN